MDRNSLARLGALALAATLVLGVSPASLAQERGRSYEVQPATPVSEETQATADVSTAPEGLSPEEIAEKAASVGTGRNKLVSVVVKLDVASLASYEGGVPGLNPTSPRVTGAEALDVTAPDSRRYLDYVGAQLDSFSNTASKTLSQATITRRLDTVIGGVAMLVPADEVGLLSQLPGVQAVYPDMIRQLDTDRSPDFIGAPSIWSRAGGQASAGEGVIVGVLDSGVWPEHPSFADPDPLGKAYDPPPATADGERGCDFTGGDNPGDPFTCNNKLIGAERFMATYDAVIGLVDGEFTTARDDDGHGTHTATTAAGNRGVNAAIFGVSRGTISGIAPRAYVMAYKVCGLDGCFNSDSAAAVGEAIEDGVDVINFSISGGENPYSDIVSLAFLDAYNAGVFVAASAGNEGPGPDTVGHREPWVTTVAASTQVRAFTSTATARALNGARLSMPGTTLTAGVGPAPVVVPPAGQELCGSAAGVNPFTADQFAGQIVVCRRGVTGRVEKGYNVFRAGAVGMILYNQSAAVTDVQTDNHFLPTIQVQFAVGQALLNFLDQHGDVTASWPAGSPSNARGDVMASFSSRGGPGQSLGISKPDVTAPGVQILAGHSPQHVDPAGGPQGELFQAIAGTSMSSPHVAGAAAMLADLYPRWTPGQIKSALMTTARGTDLVKEDGRTPFTPFDAGSGRIDLRQAWKPGITFSETAANFVALRNELWKANLPSLYVPVMPGTVTISRTAQDISGRNVTYRPRIVYPWRQADDFKITTLSTLRVPANGTATFDITVDGRDVPLGEVRHATIVFIGENGARVRFPVSFVRGEPLISVAKTCDPANVVLAQDTTCTITMRNNGFSPVDVSMRDELPPQLRLLSGTVTGGTQQGGAVVFDGTLTGRTAPDVAIGLGSFAGYLSLAGLGAPPNVTMTDETIVNFSSSRPFVFAGEEYDTVGMTSNGYAVVGGGTAQDLDFVNRDFPNPIRPNNVLAPFWTDLDGSKGGNYYAYELCAGPCSDPATSRWLVMEWERSPNFGNADAVNTFQLWIGLNGVEDITFSYGPELTNGDAGRLTVGAENLLGTSGANYYSNDGSGPVIGTAPTANQNDLVVTGTPGAPATPVTVTFRARGVRVQSYTNYVLVNSPSFFGTLVTQFKGRVVR
jgi:uncharacterized repeat protein (TIGR01451 family)